MLDKPTSHDVQCGFTNPANSVHQAAERHTALCSIVITSWLNETLHLHCCCRSHYKLYNYCLLRLLVWHFDLQCCACKCFSQLK